MIVVQIKPQFQPSSNGGPNISATSASSSKPAPDPAGQTLSYAEYVVQSKSHVPADPQRESSAKVLKVEGAGASTVKPNNPDTLSSAQGGCGTSQDCIKGNESGPLEAKMREERQVACSEQKEGEGQRSEPSIPLGPKLVGAGSSMIVSPRQVCKKTQLFLFLM